MVNHNKHISCVQRARHSMVDASVEATLDVLRIPAVTQQLGERATQLSHILERATVPNVHHGRIRLGDLADDSVPILAIYGNDDDLYLQQQDLRLNVYQRDALQLGFGAESATMLTDQYAYDRAHGSNVHIPIEPMVGSIASVMSVRSSIELEDDSMLGLQSAPLMILNGQVAGWRTPNVIAHEAYHIHQLHEYPIAMPRQHDQRAYEADELEAYAVEADIVSICRRIGRYGLLRASGGEGEVTQAERINDVRMRVQGKSRQPYRANRRIRRLLRQQQIEL